MEGKPLPGPLLKERGSVGEGDGAMDEERARGDSREVLTENGRSQHDGWMRFGGGAGQKAHAVREEDGAMDEVGFFYIRWYEK